MRRPAHPESAHSALAAIAGDWLGQADAVVAPSPATAAALRARGHRTIDRPLPDIDSRAAHAVALLDDELSRTGGDHPEVDAEGLLAEASRVLRPGGWLIASAWNRVHAAASGRDLNGLRGYSAEDLARLLGHRGFASELLCAPGAAASLTGSVRGPILAAARVDLDRQPGLLDAAPRLLAVARAPRDDAARSTAFFASLPRKVVAAAVICRDADGRVLVVHDSFKRHWTIPGGIVDADENPAQGALRECWEEAGTRVALGPLLGVFTAAWPDRIVLVYAAEPVEPSPHPVPVHAHEVDAVAWVEVEEALTLLAPHIAEQVRRCLEAPGGTWTLPSA